MGLNSMGSFIKLSIACISLFFTALAYGQWGPSYTLVRVIVSADHSDWNYRLGESVIFSVSVYKNGNPIEAKVQYEIMPETFKKDERRT